MLLKVAETVTARGERKLKCPACEGTGIIHFRNIHEICGKCKGIGFIDEEPKTKKQKTEQEWLQTADTEQLAEWLVEHIDCVNCYCKKDLCSRNHDSCKLTFVNWLKQPHHEKK